MHLLLVDGNSLHVPWFARMLLLKWTRVPRLGVHPRALSSPLVIWSLRTHVDARSEHLPRVFVLRFWPRSSSNWRFNTYLPVESFWAVREPESDFGEGGVVCLANCRRELVGALVNKKKGAKGKKEEAMWVREKKKKKKKERGGSHTTTPQTQKRLVLFEDLTYGCQTAFLHSCRQRKILFAVTTRVVTDCRNQQLLSLLLLFSVKKLNLFTLSFGFWLLCFESRDALQWTEP